MIEFRPDIHFLMRLCFSLLLGVILTACGGGGGGSGGKSSSNNSDSSVSDNNSPGNNNSNSSTGLSGRIIFTHRERTEGYGDIKQYDFASDTATLLATNGFASRGHSNGSVIFLEFCYREILPYYRISMIQNNGLIKPISECSWDIPNPGSNDDPHDLNRTHLIEINLSKDGQLIAATIEYDDVFFEPGNDYPTRQETYDVSIYSLDGTLIKTIENAYNPEWLPDGRLLYVWGSNFYVTDTNFENSEELPGSDQFSSPVYRPALHPSGNFFAFQHSGQIWQMNLDGGELKQLLTGNGILIDPAWSPDGTKLVVWRQDDFEFIHIYDIESDQAQSMDLDHALDGEFTDEINGPFTWLE